MENKGYGMVDLNTYTWGESVDGVNQSYLIASSPETISQVDRRWEKYGLGSFIESPSLHYSRLQYGDGAAVTAQVSPTGEFHTSTGK